MIGAIMRALQQLWELHIPSRLGPKAEVAIGEEYCPNCGVGLQNQPGFDSSEGWWKCTACGQFLLNPDNDNPESQFSDVGWFCDSCEAFLNRQLDFSDWCGTWTCTECGNKNIISANEIYES
jgi:ribosomal protein S27E